MDFFCRAGTCKQTCSLRLQLADLFHDLPLANKLTVILTGVTVNQTGAFHFSQACFEDTFNYFQKQTNNSYRFISELMDVFYMAGVHQQPEQSNYLVASEGQTCKLLSSWQCPASPAVNRSG